MPDEPLAEHAALVDRIGELLPEVEAVARRAIETYEQAGCVFTFGNGGSAAEAQHLAAELVGRYKRDWRPLAAVALSADAAVLTCVGNDYAFEDVFARQVEAFAGAEDVVIGFTTSGRSPNVVRGLEAARARNATTVLFSGGDGMPAAGQADHALIVPSTTTARIQEMHVLLVHLLADRIDSWAAGEPEA